MSSIFNYNYHVDSSRVDMDAMLGMDSIFSILELMVTEYLADNNSDNVTIRAKCNAAWVITKARVKIYGLAKWGEDLDVKSFLTNKRSAKIDLETVIRDKSGNILVVAKDEMAPINLETRRIVRLSDIGFDADVYPTNIDLGYNKVDNSNMKLKEKLFVRFKDIDYTKHTNNVSYIRYIMNVLDIDFFTNNQVLNIDVHYLAESKLNDELDIYRRDDDSNNVSFLIKRDEQEIFFIHINYEKKVI